MVCEYGQYEKGEYYPKLYCKIDNELCPFIYKCAKVQKYLQIENWEECRKRMEEKMKDIPKGSCYICFERKGFLYVQIDDTHIEKIKNTLGKVTQNYVYVKDGLDGYELSLKPFTQKRTYNRKNIEKAINEESKN